MKTFFKAFSAAVVTELQTGLGDQAIDDQFLLNSHLFALNKKHVKCGDASDVSMSIEPTKKPSFTY